MAPRQAANSTLRIAIPPGCELSVSVETARFIRFVRYSYLVRPWETCPREKGACSKAKLDELFGWDGYRRRPAPQRGAAVANVRHQRLRFPLTGPTVSWRI